MAKGIKIAKDGFDVDTANGDELYANAADNLFKQFVSGTGVQHFAGTASETHTIVVNHDLGYVPMLMVFMDRKPGDVRQLCTKSQVDQTGIDIDIGAFVTQVTKTTFTIETSAFGGTPAAGDYGFNYFVYHDNLSEAGRD